MDNDPEVVREPFEIIQNGEDIYEDVNSNNIDADDHNSLVSSSHQFRYDDVELEASNHDGVFDNHGSESCIMDDDNSDSLSTTAEDVNFARSFGINLKGSSKSFQADAYQRLVESKHFEQPRNRRSIGKDDPMRIKTSVTSDCIYHKGTFYQKGDIVALCDQDDGQLYFAQLTGFLQDQYCEKSASLNWLVPTRTTSREFFDPSAYRIGLEDVQLRKLDCMTFVRHCPHDYYIRKFFQSEDEQTNIDTNRNQAIDGDMADDPHLKSSHEQQFLETNYKRKGQAYIWTTMEPCRVPSIKTNPQQ